MDNQSAADSMLKLIGQAPMSEGVRAQFVEMTKRGDPSGILKALTRYIETRGDVGTRVQKAGLVSFESVYPQVKAIHDEWLQCRPK